MEKQKHLNWLNLSNNIAGILWAVVGLLCIIPAGSVLLFFDSPSPDWNANYFFIFSVISFPIVCIVSSIGILLLKNKYGILAFCGSLIPVFPLILIFVGSAWMSMASCGKLDCRTPSMQEQGNITQVGECVLPTFDGGDGLKTTGCGVVVIGASATGTISSSSEAHNWQFSTKTGNRITISIEHHGNSCSQIRILDSGGSVIESFKNENQDNRCTTGLPDSMITTSFYYFNPPNQGTFILRVTAPVAPSAYWFKIEQADR